VWWPSFSPRKRAPGAGAPGDGHRRTGWLRTTGEPILPARARPGPSVGGPAEAIPPEDLPGTRPTNRRSLASAGSGRGDVTDEVSTRTVQDRPQVVVRQEVHPQQGEHPQPGIRRGSVHELGPQQERAGLLARAPVDQRYGGLAQRAILALPLQRVGDLAALASQAPAERSPRQVAIVPERIGKHAEGGPAGREAG